MQWTTGEVTHLDLMHRRVLSQKFLVAITLVGSLSIFCATRAADSTPAPSIFDDNYPSTPTPEKPAKPEVPAPTTPPSGIPALPVSPPTPSHTQPPAVVAPEQPRGDNGVVPGLVAELYDIAGKLQDARLVKRIRVTTETPTTGFLPLVFKWHGVINIPPGGMNASFQVNGPCKAEVKIDNRVVVDETHGGVVQLTEGQHSISVTVSQVSGHGSRQTIWLGWMPAGEEFQAIPSTVFLHSKSEEPKGAVAAASNSEPPAGNVVVQRIPNPPPSPAPLGTTAVPSEAQQAELRKAIKAAYSDDYANSSRIVRDALIKKLLKAADDSNSDAAPQRYALLKEATDLAIAGGDLKTALGCTDQICKAYKVDSAEVRLGVLTAASRVAKTFDIGHDVGDAAMALSNESSDNGDYATSMKAAQVAVTSYGVSSLDAAHAKGRVQELRDLQAQYARVAPLMKKLKETPDDPDTNVKAGRYFCFTVGNWQKGLPMLAKGSDAAFKALADLEANPPTDADGDLKLGDGWWNKAHTENLLTANTCKGRAAFWYDKARGMGKDVPARVMDRLATLSRTIDLLPLVDLDAQAVQNGLTFQGNTGIPVKSNGWKRDHDTLVPSDMFAYPLQLPYRPAGDYDFIVEFTVVRGNGGIVQIMPVRGTELEWSTFSDFSNFGPLTLRRGSMGPILRGRVPIVAGGKYVSMVSFRRTGVYGYLNGALIRAWDTDYSELGSAFVKLPDPQCIGLRPHGDIVITAIRVVEQGHGKE